MGSGRARVALVAATSAVLLAATGVIVWRVLRPAEVVTPATAALPTEAYPKPGAVSVLISAPLILDERVRIFAKKREVWSDGPAGYHYERSAYWAYRRWPAQVTGVALSHATQNPVVVTTWSDGLLAGIDAESGKVLWRAQGDPLAESYEGRRTGADTVYTPTGLLDSGSIVVTHADWVRAYAAQSGEQLWDLPSPAAPGCRGIAFTTAAQLMMLDTCMQSLHRIDLAGGRALVPMPAASVEPLSCAVGHSRCAGMRVSHLGTTTGWLFTGAEPALTDVLAAPGALPAGRVAVVPTAMQLSAVDLESGQPRWAWRPQSPGPFRLLSANATRALVLESDGSLAAINASTGNLLVRTSILMDHEPDRPYAVSSSYTSGGYLVLERTSPEADVDDADDAYYFTHRPVLLAYSGLAE